METLKFLEFIRVVINGDLGNASRLLRSKSALATMALPVSPRQAQSSETFFTEISHQMYGGDTALHMAAAAFSVPMTELVVSHGANCRAKNRRGAEPIHYASDGNRSESKTQAEVIMYLVSIGADPNAKDKSGVMPLHRAVRKRSLTAVRALLDCGAKLRQTNNSGSTPLHLAVQTTGASGSGSEEARRQQESIIKLLLERGAKRTDKDLQGKTVVQATKSEWIRILLSETK